MTVKNTIFEDFQTAGQGHVFKYWDSLSKEEREALTQQAELIDLKELSRLIQDFKNNNYSCKLPPVDEIKPAGYIKHPENGGDLAAWETAKHIGETALKAGRVAAFTVAGGQGSRLGFDGPKGMLSVTPIMQKSLFQVFAEKIKAAETEHETVIPWFIMTSFCNHEATVDFFKEHHFFGLESVHFFKQGLMPAVDLKGKIILESRSSISMSPNGHGGALAGLHTSGAIRHMEGHGIDVISYFQVDNPLVQCIDPAFIGFHLQAGSEMSSKMVLKENADEKVGVFCSHKETLKIIEYSDLPRNCAQAFDASGSLLYPCGNIAVHVLSRDFVKRVGEEQLPYHCAHKSIEHLNANGTAAEKPQEPNGIKFEMFVFDALEFAKNTILVEAVRAEEFSPVKNASGPYSVETAKQDQVRLFSGWLQRNGIEVGFNDEGKPLIDIEISPTFANNLDAFSKRWKTLKQKPEFKESTYIAP